MNKKSTDDLLKIMKQSHNYNDFIEKNNADFRSMKIDRALNTILMNKGLKKSEVITRSGIENHYAYQIFSGLKLPSRDKVLMLCFGMNLTFEETQELLKITGIAPLYAKSIRDNIIIYGFLWKMNVIEVNALLYEQNMELLL